MPKTEYRLYFGTEPATRDQLDRIEEITVEQEMDMIWESQIKMPITVDKKGNFDEEDFMKLYTRVRIEVKLGKNPFVPLIDGQIVMQKRPLHAEPGQSSITLIIHDDSTLLNKDENKSFQYKQKKDSDIAKLLFMEAAEQIETSDRDIQETLYPPQDFNESGTSMQLLRKLARRNNMHAYVLPGELVGDSPGKSKGFFKSDPDKVGKLTPLTLLGKERNMETFSVVSDGLSPSKVQLSFINLIDKKIIKTTATFHDDNLMGDKPIIEDKNTGLQTLHPYRRLSLDADQSVKAEAIASNNVIKGVGNILEDCYPDVLQPYEKVTVMGVGEIHSGDYVISKVTHKLTRFHYLQSFEVKRNAVSDTDKAISASSALGALIS